RYTRRLPGKLCEIAPNTLKDNVLCGQLLADRDGLGDGGQRVPPPAQLRQRADLVVQRPRQVGVERVRAGGRQRPVGVDRLGGDGLRLLPPAQLRQRVGLVAQRNREVGVERVRAGSRQLP